MLRLAIECSGRAASLALATESGKEQSSHFAADAHARELLPRLHELLQASGHKVGELAELIVGAGPGSYTGLRVAMATALGLARAVGAKIFSLPSYEAAAWRALAPTEAAVVASDARGGQLYYARYLRQQSDLRPLEPLCLLPRAALREHLHAGERPLLDASLASDLGLAADGWRDLNNAAAPSAQALLELAEARRQLGRLEPTPTLEPLYLRPFAASIRKR